MTQATYKQFKEALATGTLLGFREYANYFARSGTVSVRLKISSRKVDTSWESLVGIPTDDFQMYYMPPQDKKLYPLNTEDLTNSSMVEYNYSSDTVTVKSLSDWIEYTQAKVELPLNYILWIIKDNDILSLDDSSKCERIDLRTAADFNSLLNKLKDLMGSDITWADQVVFFEKQDDLQIALTKTEQYLKTLEDEYIAMQPQN